MRRELHVTSSGPGGFEAVIDETPSEPGAVSDETPSEPYDGWAKHATRTTNLLLNGAYGPDRDDEWQALVSEAVHTLDAVPGAYLVAASDALRRLVTDDVVLAAINTIDAPATARLYVTDMVTSMLEQVHWSELVEAHLEDADN